MKFFKPEDFEGLITVALTTQELEAFALKTNAKLERDAKVVYSHLRNEHIWAEKGYANDTIHKALLINIEPIEKCTHPKDKVHPSDWTDLVLHCDLNGIKYRCECGAPVVPEGFKAV